MKMPLLLFIFIQVLSAGDLFPIRVGHKCGCMNKKMATEMRFNLKQSIIQRMLNDCKKLANYVDIKKFAKSVNVLHTIIE